MNVIFVALLTISVVTAAFTGNMQQLTEAGLSSAKSAVDLAIGLIAQMTLWLGFVGVIREAGLLKSLSRALFPLMIRLFPEIPRDHPAIGSMIMNLAANMLGLGNAATPFGLKAMQELDSLNTRRGVATNSMALFLVLNTSGVAVLPLSAIAVRAAWGSKDPAGIIIPSLLAAALTTVCAVIAVKLLERLAYFSVERLAPVPDAPPGAAERVSPAPDPASLEHAQRLAQVERKTPMVRQLIVAAVLVAVLVALARHIVGFPAESKAFDVARSLLSQWLLPVLMLTIVLLGFGRQVKVYEAFIASAKEGFSVAVNVIPFLVAILVVIGMLRASGAMEAAVTALSPLLAPIGFPPDALPMALIRPLSGSGALGVMAEAMKRFGPDSFVGYLVSVLNGTTETTFYVLALYFGSVQVRVLRHTMVACLFADVVGPLAALLVCRAFF